MKGSYTVLLKVSKTVKVEVGSLDSVEFSSGFYAYNGSAFGPGGLKRVERHREKSREGSGCHWHIDYLLTLENSELIEVFRKEGSDHECSLSQEMKDKFNSVDDFGCSDCGCDSHLFFSQEKEDIDNFLNVFYS